MPWSSFIELTKQVHLCHDIILEDMVYEHVEHENEVLVFSKHLYAIKNWFTRISAPNKKRFLLALLEDILSAQAVSVILLCIWNCRPKDAVLSASVWDVWSSYDRTPMDHNRTALPMNTLTQVMKSDRKWFLSLEPDNQSVVICELLSVSGGPIMREILYRAQVIYERYRNHQLKNIEMSIMVNDLPPPKEEKPKPAPPVPQKKDPKSKAEVLKSEGISSTDPSKFESLAQKKYNECMAEWEATINTMKDGLNLKEMEVIFKDGTTRNIWKVRRTNPEDIETVDFVSLLPSSIGKRILSFLPRAHLGDYARINKYWAYLVDDLRAEHAARAKINADMEKLQMLVLRNDTSAYGSLDKGFQSVHLPSNSTSVRVKPQFVSGGKTAMTSSLKSGAGAYTFRHFLSDRMKEVDNVTGKCTVTEGTAIRLSHTYVPNFTRTKSRAQLNQIPIRRLADLTERLDCRGAIDDNVWGWCDNILKRRKHREVNKTHASGTDAKESDGGVMLLGMSGMHFGCPLMSKTLKLPLNPPLVHDHTTTYSTLPKRNISNATVMSVSRETRDQRVCLWTRNLSRLYLATKVPSFSKLNK